MDLINRGYDSLSDGILIVDKEGQIRYHNRAFIDILGLQEDLPVNLIISELIAKISSQIIGLHNNEEFFTSITNDPKENHKSRFNINSGIIVDVETSPIFTDDHAVSGWIWVLKNVTEMVLNLERLNHSEQLFRSIFNLIPEGIAISDLNRGVFFKVNDQFSYWWGFTEEEVIGKSAIDLNFWVEKSERDYVINLLKRDGIFKRIPVKMRNKKGEIRDILLSGRVITINDVQYMLSIPYDITGIKQYEKKIGYLASFIELSPDPIFEINKDGKITLSNKATTTVITDLTDSGNIEIFIPENLEEILNGIKDNSEASFYREIIIKDHVFLEIINISPLYKSAHIYATDITEKKRAEEEILRKNQDLAAAFEEITSAEEELRDNYNLLIEQEAALRENESKLRMIVNHIPGIVLTIDTKMRITGLYGAALPDLGLSPNAGLGQNWKEVFPNMGPEFVESYANALVGISSSLEGEYLERKFLLFTEPLRNIEEKIIGTIGIAFDISEKKRWELDREQLLLQLEQNMIELSILNDKIRNPLTVISTLSAMYEPELEQKISLYINQIDDIITNLDRRWVDSEKTIRFLQKHYNIRI